MLVETCIGSVPIESGEIIVKKSLSVWPGARSVFAFPPRIY